MHASVDGRADGHACRARCGACEELFLRQEDSLHADQRLPRFYVHNSAGFNFNDVAAALAARQAGRAVDLVLPVQHTQYMIDPPLLSALEAHPSRTYDAAEAELHVIGALPVASYVLSQFVGMDGRPAGDLSAHYERMSRLARSLRDNEHFRARKPFLFVYGHHSYPPLGPELVLAVGSGNVIVGTTDPMFWRDVRVPLVNTSSRTFPASDRSYKRDAVPDAKAARAVFLCGKGGAPCSVVSHGFSRMVRQGITLPLLPHSLAHEVDAGASLERRRVGVMFHGGIGRSDFGLRERMLLALTRLAASGVKVDRRVAEMTRGDSKRVVADAYAASAHSYLDASLCMSPSGDVTTSRRLFDALEAGCVPVLTRSWFTMHTSNASFYTALPFPRSIDWRAATLRFAPSRSECKAASEGGTDAQWLARWHAATGGAGGGRGGRAHYNLEQRRRAGRAAFREWMDYVHNPQGVATALLREIAPRLVEGEKPRGLDRLVAGVESWAKGARRRGGA